MMGVSNLLHGLGNGIDIQNVVVGFSMDIQPSYNVWSITSDLDVSWYKPARLGDNLTGSSSPDPALLDRDISCVSSAVDCDGD